MSIMNSKERKARNRGRKQGYEKAIDDMTVNLLRNSSTEIIAGRMCLVVTEERIKVIAQKMKTDLNK